MQGASMIEEKSGLRQVLGGSKCSVSKRRSRRTKATGLVDEVGLK